MVKVALEFDATIDELEQLFLDSDYVTLLKGMNVPRGAPKRRSVGFPLCC
jgi:hypothetical protein